MNMIHDFMLAYSQIIVNDKKFLHKLTKRRQLRIRRSAVCKCLIIKQIELLKKKEKCIMEILLCRFCIYIFYAFSLFFS